MLSKEIKNASYKTEEFQTKDIISQKNLKETISILLIVITQKFK